ncbi:MAG: GTP-dependent dephospho-CoA kinase family protein [Haloplanus sp.]
MLELPADLRGAFKEPLGRVFTDPEALLAADEAGDPLVAVGDVVTYHLLDAGHHPDVAVIDGKTERHAVDDAIGRALPDPDIEVRNPPATLSRELLNALATALDRSESTVVGVDGEEDLAALPALIATPRGGAVVYGQPGEGMVLVPVTDDTRAQARALLTRMRGDTDAALSLLGA